MASDPVDIDVAPTADDAAVRAAAWLADRARAAIDACGAFHLAVSGGSSPVPMFRSFAAAAGVEWGSVHLYQVDERVAPDGSGDRNATSLQSALLDRVAVPEGQLHLMDVTAADLDAAAARYGQIVAGVRFDVVHLGLGDDGHTASWPPGDPVVERSDGVAVVGPFHGFRRMTLTPAPVNGARQRLWLVTGGAKQDMLARILAADPTTPASHVSQVSTALFCDAAADPGPGRRPGARGT